jgi:ATP-dependent helicase HrpA
MLEEKVTALIKSLPGGLRRNFVPVPDFAKAAIANMGAAGDLSLTEALAKELSRMTGVEIVPADFKLETLPDYLKMAFRVVDDAGKTAALSRDLPAIQRKLAKEANHAFSKLPGHFLQRDDVPDWDFGDLPEVVRVQRFNMTIDAYPALEVRPDGGVSLRLFPHGLAAEHNHRAGLRRLFALTQRREIKSMLAYVTGFDKMALLYRSMGPSQELRASLVELIIDQALIGEHPPIRTLEQWKHRREAAVDALLEVGDKTFALIGEILNLRHQLSLRLDEAGNAWPTSLADIHDQITYLLPHNFMLSTPREWLAEYPRYLGGILSRLAKLSNGNYARDAEHTQEIAPLWSALIARAEQHRSVGLEDPELSLYRWMLEEYRISLFAQELHTRFPISARRLERQWAKVQS